MSESKDAWFLSRAGETFGPVPFSKVVEAARSGQLEPRTDMLYGGDLADWVPAGQVDGVFEKAGPEPEPAAPETSSYEPPEESMADSGSYDFGEGSEHYEMPGAVRLGYFLGMTVLPVILGLGVFHSLPVMMETVGEPYAAFVPLVILVVPLVLLVITVKRFQNLAMTGWWVFGLLVPGLNYWLQYRLFACPPGYAYTKKLDGIGKVLAVLYWLTVVGSLALSILSGAAMVAQLSDEGQLQELRNRLADMIEAAEAAKAGESGS